MSKVAIISDIHDWHSNQIEYFLKKNNVKTSKITFEELVFSFKNNKVFFKNNKLLNDINGIWVRFLKAGTLEEITTKLTILHLLKEMKIYIHNSASVIEKTVDKVRTTGILELNGINTPETTVWFEKKKFNFNFKQNKKYLIKPIFGSQGKNIVLVKNPNLLKKQKITGEVFYLQEFIESSGDKFNDIRVFVSNHKILSSMERVSDHFITNIYQGAKSRKISLGNKIEEICKKISRIFKLGYGGIDIKIFEEKIYVLEVNSIPSWKMIQKTTKKNISEILVEDFIKNLRK